MRLFDFSLAQWTLTLEKNWRAWTWLIRWSIHDIGARFQKENPAACPNSTCAGVSTGLWTCGLWNTMARVSLTGVQRHNALGTPQWVWFNNAGDPAAALSPMADLWRIGMGGNDYFHYCYPLLEWPGCCQPMLQARCGFGSLMGHLPWGRRGGLPSP